MKVKTRNINLNNRFLEDLSIEEKRAFALVLKLKAKHTNSIIYNFSYKTISKKANVSEYFAKKYTDIILNRKWAFVNEKNEFVILSLKKIFNDNRFKEYAIWINENDKVSDIVDKMNFVLLKKNVSNQKRAYTFKSYDQYARIDCPKSKLSLKDYKRLVKQRRYNPELFHGAFIEGSIIGLRRLAELLNCSVSSAQRFLKRIAQKGLVKLEEQIERIKEGVKYAKFLPENDFGYYFVFNDTLYLHRGTKITLNSCV